MTDTNQAVQKFDINDAAEKLKGQIRSAFIELLTPEQFQEMVRVELTRFTSESTEQRGYPAQTMRMPSGFEKLCSEVFSGYVRDELKTMLQSADWSESWGANGKQQMSNAIKSWLTENSKELIESTILVFAGSAAQQMLDQLKHR